MRDIVDRDEAIVRLGVVRFGRLGIVCDLKWLCAAKIGQCDVHGTFCLEHHVLGLDIAMQDRVFVQVLEAEQHAGDEEL